MGEELRGINGGSGGIDQRLQSGQAFGHVADSLSDLGLGYIGDRRAGLGGGQDPYHGG